MNKFFNISKSTGRKLSATVLVLVASLLGAGSAWAANIGFYETKDSYVWDVQFGYNGTNYVQHGDRSTYSSDANLGILTTDLYLDGFYAWCWGGSTTRYVKMYSALKYNSGSFTSFSEEYSQTWNATGDQQISTPSFSGTKKLYALSGLSAGDYQYKYYLEIVPSGSDAVADGQGYCSNNGSNMWVYFTVPGFINATTSATIVADPESTKSKTISFKHYGTALTKSNCSITGTDASMFSVASINENGVTVSFTAPSTLGTHTATLTITDANSKVLTIALTGTSGYSTTVTIADDPVVENGPMVTLSGYLKYSGCDETIMNYGFVYSSTATTPTASNSVVNISSETTLPAKSTFSKTFFKDDAGTALSANTTYYYRAYAKNGENTYYYSEVGTFITGSACQITVGDTIYYTIDNTQVEDPCSLRFQTVADAIADAKTTHYDTNGDAISAWINSGNIVQVPIVFEVAAGTYGNSDNSTRLSSLENMNTTSISNYVPTPASPGERLIVRAADAKSKPVFKGGLSLMGARNVTLKNLKVTRSTSTSNHTGSAVEYGYYVEDSDTPNTISPGTFANTNCEMIGCEIVATGFNCIHATACNGLLFDECVFNLEGTDTSDNAKNWGASVKLMSCNNVQFTRNNLRGSHATTLFLQHIQNSVIMNNVFWNDNLFTSNVAFVRPVVYSSGTKHNIQYLGVYYNTFYLKDNASAAYNVDYLRFGGPAQTGNASYYKADLIEFKWNNCYSYDDKISARNTDATAFLSVTLPSANFAYNNFWSKGDSEKDKTAVPSKLAFGSETHHVNVEDQVCKSTASDPDDLVLKGSDLNLGDKPTSDISGLDVANNTYADRFNTVIRSEGGDWTYGAFQMANRVEVDTIIWAGGTSDAWDLRTNWVTTSGKRLNCANVFAANLHVIIPDAAELSNVPTIPLWADTKTRGAYPEEYVAAGLKSDLGATTKFASAITIKEGGAIKGVENLNSDGTLRYDGADNKYTALRSQWILVGGVIKPFANGTSGDAREVQSGDFYIADHKPHVYMQHFERKDNSIVPGTPFTSLTEEVATNSAFGIYIPDQYGDYKVTAQRYYTRYEPNASMVGDGTVPKTFAFNGRFANEAALPTYSIAATNTWYFVNNSYPANLNVAKLLANNSAMGLNAKVYSYTDKSWDDVTASESEASAVYVKPNNGFVLYASTSTGDVQTTQAQYGNGTTIYYKRASVDTYAKIKVKNTADATASTLNVRYEAQSLTKAFSYNASTPEIYVVDGETKYSTYGTNDLTEVIPLGLRNKQTSGNLTVQFTLTEVGGFESVVLEDRLMNKTYDLTAGETPYFSGIVPGDCEGRFFLNINYANEDEPVIPTDAKESADADASIDIYSSGNVLTVSATDGVKIEKIELCDLAGRMFSMPVQSDNFSQNVVKASAGVYTVKVTSDLGTSVKKVIIK